MTRHSIIAALVLFGTFTAQAEKPQHPETPPLSPAEAIKSIHVPEGYEVELVVAEPLVMDPTAITWGRDGRLWVAEMTDYPLGIDNDGKAAGRVRWLKDTDGDGRYDESVVFADGLAFPNGLLPWRDGVLVTAAPEILYLADIDGDGVAEHREPLFTGFNPGNQQLRVNGLRWGLDNWIHCASGSHTPSYGKDAKITSEKTGETIELGSRDFRFHPDTGEMQPMSGPTQYGKNRDDWDNWFGCMNSYPLWHYVLEDRYLRRNPHIAAPDPRVQLVLPRNPKVYPAKTPQKRFHSFQHSGHYTSACAAMIYRDRLLFPPENYADGALHGFTCEPFHNLVQHHVVEPQADGFSFKRSYRDPNEVDTDFFASEDRWCRPVMARTGPDGALWVVDMYRYIIEHPQFLTPEAKEEFGGKYRRGNERGRIWRVFPKGKEPTIPTPLETLDDEELIAALGSNNGWVRDAAQRRLLNEKNPRSRIETAARIADLLKSSKQPVTRAHALSFLDAAVNRDPEIFIAALADPHPGVRRQALRSVESQIEQLKAALMTTQFPKGMSKNLLNAVLAMRSDPDPKVRLQFACTIGDWPADLAGPAIGKMAATDPLAGDNFLQAALLSSVTADNIGATMSALLAEPDQKHSGPFTGRLLALAVAFGDDDATVDGLARILDDEAKSNALQRQFETLSGLLDALERKKSSLEKIAASTAEKGAAVLATVGKITIRAQQTFADSKAPAEQRIAAIQLVARSPDKSRLQVETDLLFTQLTPKTPGKVQAAIVAQLGRQRDPAIAEQLLAGWRGYVPAVHAEIFNVLLTRKEWMPAAFEVIETGTITQADISSDIRQRLFAYPNKAIRDRLTKLLADTTSPDRRQVIADHQPVLKLEGNADKGKAVFAKACFACHRLDGQGIEIGPNLVSITDKNPASLLSAILDPSASVDAKYFTYVAETNDGRAILGILVSETGVNITLLDQANQKHVLLRSEIKSLQSTGRSLMVDGLEAGLNHQDFADLIAYVRGAKK